MSIITFAYSNPGSDGVDVAAVGDITCRLVSREVVAGAFRTVEGFRVSLVDGKASVTLSDTAPGQLWRISESRIAGATVRHVVVAGNAAFAALADVDPATLQPSAAPDAAWAVSLDALTVRVDGISTGGTSAEVQAAVTASTAHIANISNPHSTTKAQVGLANVPNTDFTAAVALNTAKVTYPSADAAKLAAITGTNTGDQVLPTSTSQIAPSTNRGYLTDAQALTVSGTSGTNTGDNATNTQYSGLALSKQNALTSGQTIKTVNGATLLGSGDVVTHIQLTQTQYNAITPVAGTLYVIVG